MPALRHCFFFRARREAARADLLVVNHHILLADIAMRAEGARDTAILPGYSRLIIDEGHNLEDGATSYFGGQDHEARPFKDARTPAPQKGPAARHAAAHRLPAYRKGGSRKEKGEAWRTLIRERIVPEKESVSLRVNEAFDELFYFISRESESPGGESRYA